MYYEVIPQKTPESKYSLSELDGVRLLRHRNTSHFTQYVLQSNFCVIVITKFKQEKLQNDTVIMND